MQTKILFLFLLIMVAGSSTAANRRFTLVIDAGHGGHDTGAMGAVSKEKDINLNVALAFGRKVERGCPDVNIIYTRKTDVFIPLMERAEIANRAGADLFISVHTNALPAGKIARGFETYTLGMHRAKDNLDVAMRENAVISMEKGYQQTYEGFDPKSSESYIMFEFIQGRNMEKSVDLARMVQRSVCQQASRPDKGVHQAGFLVLRETSMPSCLLELGFITTPDEEEYLNNPDNVEIMAEGIFQAFVQYKNKYDHHLAVPFNVAAQAKEAAPKPLTPATQKPVEKPKTAQEPEQAKSVAPKPSAKEADKNSAPVFKVQVLASDRKLREGDNHFKGVTGCDAYFENGLYKYTQGASADYNEIYRLRKSLLEKFPEAFIVAFKNGTKCDVSQAIAEFKKIKNK